MEKAYKIVCEDCQSIFTANSLRAKRCQLCKKAKKREHDKIYYKEVKKEKEQAEDVKIKNRARKRKEYSKNKEKKKQLNKQWRSKNQDKVRELRINYYKNNKEYHRQRAMDFYHKNKDKILSSRKKRREHRIKNDHMIRLKENLRSLCYNAFSRNGYEKNSKTEEVLGADFETVKSHLESLFDVGMSWDNYGKWQIDHVIPIAAAEDYDHLMGIMNYLNLQPLWRKDNASKSNLMPCKWVID